MPWFCLCCGRQQQRSGRDPNHAEPSRCLIVTDRGERVDPVRFEEVLQRIATPDFVLGADGGAQIAADLGLCPDTLIGDFDSLTESALADFSGRAIEIVRFPSVKNETDSHLAMRWAASRGFGSIDVLIDCAGRLDHVLGTIWAATEVVDMGIAVRFFDLDFEAMLLKGPAVAEIRTNLRLVVSLLPLGGSAERISIRGLKYKLDKEDLQLGESRGISNETIGKPASIEVGSGYLLVTATKPR